MFNKFIGETALTSQIADKLFYNINYTGKMDLSFLSTLRVLLKDRITRDIGVCVSNKNVFVSHVNPLSMSVEQYFKVYLKNWIYSSIVYDYSILILHYDSSDDFSLVDTIKSNKKLFKKIIPELYYRHDIKIYYGRKLNALFYTNEQNTFTLILTDKLKLDIFHALQSMIPKYLPNLFKNTCSLNEDEILLLKSLEGKSEKLYLDFIDQMVKDYKFRDEYIKYQLENFIPSIEEKEYEEIKSNIEVLTNNFENNLQNLRDLNSKIEQSKRLLASFINSSSANEVNDKLIEYVIHHKDITIEYVEGDSICLVVCGYIDSYDIEALEQYMVNYNGFLYTNLNPLITMSQMKTLYKAVFIEEKYKLRICAAYKANMKLGLKAFREYRFSQEFVSYFANPHIHKYGCLGTFSGRFMECLFDKDYIGAFNQIVLSTRNLNFCDSSVMSYFAETFSKTSKRCLESVNGVLLTPIDVIKELESEK